MRVLREVEDEEVADDEQEDGPVVSYVDSYTDGGGGDLSNQSSNSS